MSCSWNESNLNPCRHFSGKLSDAYYYVMQMFTGLSALCSSCVGSGIMGCDWLAQLGVGRRWVGRYNSEICQSVGPLFKGWGPTPSRPSRPEVATSSAPPASLPHTWLRQTVASQNAPLSPLTLHAKNRLMRKVKVGSPWLHPRNPLGGALGHQECPPEFALLGN